MKYFYEKKKGVSLTKRNENKMEATVMRSVTKQVRELLKAVGTEYNFDGEAALAKYWVVPATASNSSRSRSRGRPEKPAKQVVTRETMVVDVIQTILDGQAEMEAATAVVPAVVEAAVVEAVVAPKKKPTKKKTETVVTETVAPVAVEVVAEAAAVTAPPTTSPAAPGHA